MPKCFGVGVGCFSGHQTLVTILGGRINCKFFMTIINTICHLAKFEMSNNKWQNPLSGRQGQNFKLMPKHPEYKHIFTLDINNYLTNLDTDFMLDMDTNSIVLFDVATLVPTVENLYEVYLHVNRLSNVEIIKRAKKEGIDVDVTAEDAPIETLRDGFNKALGIMLIFDK